jgi:putative membrane protein
MGSHLLITTLVGFVALQHVAFALLEMVLWSRPLGRRVFGLTPEKAKVMAPMALNQGLYNLFLAAGLFWGLQHPDPAVGRSLEIFFLSCVAIAGLVGGLTVKKIILAVQGLPAALALGIIWLG